MKSMIPILKEKIDRTLSREHYGRNLVIGVIVFFLAIRLLILLFEIMTGSKMMINAPSDTMLHP